MLSVRKIVEAGNRVIFGPRGAHIEDCATGETLELQSVGGMYVLKIWVKNHELDAVLGQSRNAEYRNKRS